MEAVTVLGQSVEEECYMKKFRTIVSVIMMCLAGIVGLFFGGILDEAMGGAILFSMIAGIACIVYAIENRDS